MKSLNLAKPLLILVVGLPGSGKSFFAQQFSETFGAPIVSADRLRHYAFAMPTYTPSEQLAAERLAEHFTQEIARTKRSFLIDGSCNTKQERLKYYNFAKQNGYDVFVVWVQTDDLTSKQRAMRRSATRPGDAYNRSLTLAQYSQLATRFVPPTTETHVVISGKHTYATQAKMVLRRLAAPRAEAAAKAHQEQAPAKRAATPAVPKAPPRPAPVRRGIVIQ